MLLQLNRTVVFPLIAVLTAISWVSIAGAQPGSRQLRQDEVSSAVQFDVIEDHGAELLLRYRLNVEDYSRVSGRLTHPTWLVGPERNGTVTVVPEELLWVAVTEDGLVEGPYHHEDATRWGSLPTQFSQVRTSLTGTFRLAGWHKADFLLSSPGTLRDEEGTTNFHFILVEGLFIVSVDEDELDEERRVEDLSSYDPQLIEVANLAAINAPQVHTVALSRPPLARQAELEEWDTLLSEAALRGPITMAKISREGVHALSAADLRLAGLDPAAFHPGRTRVYLDGQELPATLLNPGSQERFAGDTRLVFYVPKDPNDRQPYRAVWFLQGPAEEQPKRISQRRTGQRTAATPDFEATTKSRIFQANVYDHDQPLGYPTLRWGTRTLDPGSFADFEFSLDGTRFDDHGTLDVWVHNKIPINQVELEFLINGQSLHQESFRGTRTNPIQVQVPGTILREGTNILTVHLLPSRERQPSAPVTFVLAEFRAPADVQRTGPQRVLDVDATGIEELAFRINQVEGFEGDPSLFDITDPYDPVIYQFRSIRSAGERYFEGVVAAGEADQKRIVWANAESFLPVRNIRAVAPPRFLSRRDPVTYLVIHDERFTAELQPLLDLRREDFDVEAVTATELFNTFSHGEKSYQAIHEAIRHAFVSRDGARLQKVLLVGEASEYWWDLEHPREDVPDNMVPIFGWADPSVRFRGDESYTLLFGDGPLSDVDLGRFSVNTTEELRAIIEKTIAYSTDPPPGEWMDRHLFVLDDEAEFIRVAEDVIRKSINGANIPEILALQDFPYENYFRGMWRKRSVEMTETLIDEMNAGASTITYLGHGAPIIWSSERIFHLRDIPLLNNEGRQPIMIAGSCDTGWLDYPVEPASGSLAERLLRQPGGGVAAAFIPVDGTTSYEHNFLITAFYSAMTGQGVDDVGRLASLSKMNYFLHRNNRSVPNQYILVGDPALRMPSVREDIEVAVSPAELPSLTGGQLAVQAASDALPWGVARATLLGPNRQIAHQERLRVLDGRTSGILTIPDYLEPGDYTLILSGFSEEDSVHQRAQARVRVVETDVRLEWAESSATTSVVQAGRPIPLELRILNNSEAELPSVRLEMVSGESGNTLVHTELALPPGADGQWRQQLPIPPGVTSIYGRLTVPPAGNREQPLILADELLVLRARDNQPRYVDLPPGAISVEALPDNYGSRITFPVYNLYEGTLPTVTASLVWKRDDGDRQIGDPVELDGFEENGQRVLEFETPYILPAGQFPLSLELHTGEGEERRLLQARVFQPRKFRGPDLEIVPGSLHIENEHALSGTTVFVRFRVRNSGTDTAGPVRPNIHIDEPWSTASLAPVSVSRTYHPEVPSLLPGEEHEFRLRWDPESTSHRRARIYATVEHGGDRPELNLRNNEAYIDMELAAPPNLRIAAEDAWTSHQVALPNERVQVSIPFRNDSPNDFRQEFRVAAYAIGATGGRREVFSRTYEGIGAGEDAVLQFDWEVRPGEHEVELDVNEDREYMEETYESNVHRLRFTRALAAMDVLDGDGRWEFSDLHRTGRLSGLHILPGNVLTLHVRPQAVVHETPLYSEFLVDGSLGFDQVHDNLWGYREGGHILQAHGEGASPVRFRFPLDPEDRTSYYDVYLHHVGDLRPEVNSGHFRYRFAGEPDWQTENRRQRGRVHMGRYLARHGHFEAEFAAVEYPAFNHIWRMYFAPVMGIYESAVVTQARPFGDGLLLAEAHEPGNARVDFEVRYGTGTLDAIEWSAWQEARAGHLLPTAPAEARHFQWRARLFGAPDGSPELQRVFIDWYPEPDTPSIATQSEIRHGIAP